MPRTAKRVSPNRTDLIGARPLPNTPPPSQNYGDRAAQAASMRAIPMAPTPIAAGAPPATPPAPGAPPNAADLQGLLAQHIGQNGAGRAGPFTRPTERPNEPVTHGLPIGPGGGPEVLQGIGAAARDGAVEQGTVANLLTSMAAQPTATAAIRDLAARAVGGAQ